MHSSFVHGGGASGPDRLGEEPTPLERRLGHLRRVVEAEEDPTHRIARRATLETLDRVTRADRDGAGSGSYPDGWELFADTVEGLVGEDRWPMRVAVTANLLGIVDRSEADDFVTADRLVKRYGHRKVAVAQAAVDGLLDTGKDLPVGTRAVELLSQQDRVAEVVRAAGWNEDRTAQVVERCHLMSFWLILTDVDPSRPGPYLPTAEELARHCDHGGLRAWRGQVAIVASNPWAPYGATLAGFAREADRPFAAFVLEEAGKVFRARFERKERELVAREIRRLVAMSGLSQREFASMAGTSASRLSTYVNGLVTPSATMMVRIRRVSELAQKRSRKED